MIALIFILIGILIRYYIEDYFSDKNFYKISHKNILYKIGYRDLVYIFWSIVIYSSYYFYCYFSREQTFIYITMAGIFFMTTRMYLDFKYNDNEKEHKSIKYMFFLALYAFIRSIVAPNSLSYEKYFIYTFYSMGFFFGIILGICLDILNFADNFFNKNKEKIKKVTKNVKNEISNLGSKKEYEINIIEKEQLKIETKIDEENSSIERKIEYKKARLIIIKERTRSFSKRLLGK